MLRRMLFVVVGLFAGFDAEAANVNVNCAQGETIRAALARLDRHKPNTVNVRGTCVESVEVRNFEQLTLRGRGGAVIAEPSDVTPELTILNSQDIVVRDLTIGSIGGWSISLENCQDCRVENTTIEGLSIVAGPGRVTFLKSTLRANGNYAALGTYDNSMTRIVNCTLEPGVTPPNTGWAGLNSEDGSVVHVGGTSILGFNVGIAIGNGAHLHLRDESSVPGSDPDQTVVVENASTWGFAIEAWGGSTVDLGSVARLRINGPAGGGGGGVSVTAQSTVRVNTGAEIVDTGAEPDTECSSPDHLRRFWACCPAIT